MGRDPVCGMMLKVKDENLAVEFNKKTYYFCSELCKLQFLQNPNKHIQKEGGGEHKQHH